MGNSLPRISTCNLPSNSSSAIEYLKTQGFEFNLTPGENGRLPTMVPVTKFPDTWGLWVDWDRGDICNGSIIDPEGFPVVSFNWMSKGSYDNEAMMRVCEKPDRKLDLSLVIKNSDGFYVSGQTKHDKYIDLANEYYEMQYCGSHQTELDDAYSKLMALHETIPFVDRVIIDKLVEKNTFNDVATAMAIAWAKPFSYKEHQEVWISKFQ